ncbi:MAG TPA: alpha/beta hydrolase [Candidatus Angelobacter sp.]|nr:alpha/beta hydrolase [Candidatus Angelobacter sp.]
MATSVIARSRSKKRIVITFMVVVLTALLATGTAFYERPGMFVTAIQRFRVWRMGIDTRSVMLGSFRINYIVAGEGRPIVLVHGLAGRAEDWLDLIPSLARNGFKVYAPDLLGFGRSSRPDVEYSISQQEDMVLQFMDSQHLQQPDVAGWSMGGWIALKFAADHPERVRRLILLSSAGLKFDAVNAPALRPKTEAELAHMMAILTPHPKVIPSFYAQELLRDFAAEDWVIDRSLKSMFAGKDIMDGKMGSVKLPVMIAWGKQDVLTPPSIGEEMRREMPQSVYFLFDDSGHLAPTECSARLGPHVVEFLKAEPAMPAGIREEPCR